jgi:hypothetical protein
MWEERVRKPPDGIVGGAALPRADLCPAKEKS